jgi:hypothetical protein
MADAAWWVGPLVTVVGVLVTQFVVLLLFYLRLRADDSRRWSQHKVDAYAVFFKTALRLRQDVVQGRVLTKEDLDQMNEHYGVVLLLSSDSVRKPAGYVMRAVEQAMHNDGIMSEDDWRKTRALKFESEMTHFMYEARREVGMPVPGPNRFEIF